ncbi:MULTISPECIES: hypothetical protein [unclassified Variovorax]|uniref:hypothetical protein n=1 Tax=unclassified Variovorax TaxID=663243 RepID=UPI002578219C|nr:MULTISPECIES: hypothetical protein [unclassified Variovorax]MDM0088975.1 hypothetical protein [Variovorax sp. J22G40]MDM0147048.1 hypothetical protein [Variovorax sp. J2P1-31]
MSIDPQTAERPGFPRPHDTTVERERRWLCRDFPRDLLLAEVECQNPELLTAFPDPDFALCEITENLHAIGGDLVSNGLPGPH